MTTNVETKEQKRIRMAELGYVRADHPGRCCLCGKGITPGQYLAKMPAGWQPRSRLRWAHRRCHAKLVEQIRARAARVSGTARVEAKSAADRPGAA